MQGYRKLFAFIITILLYAIIVIWRPTIPVFDLGLAMAGILVAFSAPNAISYFAQRGTNNAQSNKTD